jgi:hypothetical protein
MKQILLTLCGAVVGGTLGFLAFFWIVDQGFYALVLPGGLLGLGAGIGKPRTVWPAVLCGLLATALGLVTEWRFSPFKVDHSLAFFLQHIHHLEPITLVMIALGGVMGFCVPFQRREKGDWTGGRKNASQKTGEGPPDVAPNA